MTKTHLLSAFFLSLLTFSMTAMAEDCMHDPIISQNWNAVVTTGMRVRNIPCMESSQVLTTVAVGTVVRVIAETDGYYQVELSDGTQGWVGQWLVERTDSDFTPVDHVTPPVTMEPLYDIKGNHYETAIRYLAARAIVQGYPDGSYKPAQRVNRAEFVKILVGAMLARTPETPTADCFPDVKKSDWFAPYVCYALENNIIAGYPDGTFKPAGEINLAEAAKIVVGAMAMPVDSETPNSPWYRPFIETLQIEHYIPSTFNSLEQKVDRSQMAELIWRILEKKHDQASRSFEF